MIGEEEILEKIDPRKIPRHVAIIMDGNRRWAKKNRLPVFMGHKKGVDTFRSILKACIDIKIPFLSVYAFSVENWRRSKLEVKMLLQIFKYYSRVERNNLIENGIRLRIIGNLEDLPLDLQRELAKTEAATRNNDRLNLSICVNYGARAEILRAARDLAREAAEGVLKPEEITEEVFSKHLFTKEIPDPDLLIRTSGELRISNFLLWQSAYTEFWFTPVFWPDFTRRDFFQAIYDYQMRERRYGGSAG